MIMSTKQLQIGSFDLPAEVVTARIAIIAQVDGGKTYLSGVIEEEFEKNQIPMVIIDSMGAHWGIRSKYPVIIAGHMNHVSVKADIELEPTDGIAAAYMVIETPYNYLFDISGWGRDQQRIFVTALLEAMYRINKTPRHIIIEEADAFAPQTKENRYAKESFYAVDNIVRRGRQLGFGTTVITQRPQLISKDILNMTQLLIIGKMNAPRDIQAVKEYLRYVGMDELVMKETMQDIVTMAKDEKLIISPNYLKLVEKIKIRARETYHAGRTPSLDDIEEIPRLVPVDIKPGIAKLNDWQTAYNRKAGIVTNTTPSSGLQWIKEAMTFTNPTPKKVGFVMLVAIVMLGLALTV